MSPIFDRSYRPWQGERSPQGTRFLAIAFQGLRRAFRSKWVWILFAATAIHVAIRGGILYFTGQVQIPPGGVSDSVREQIEFGPTFMAEALAFQARWFVLLLLALVAASSLARDLKAGALQFYFSKPITRTGYVAGKLIPPVTVCMLATAVPVLLLWLLGVAFTPETLLPDGVWLMPLELLLASFVISLVASSIVLALSGLIRSTNLAAAAWLALALIGAAGATLVEEITGEPLVGLIDVFGVLDKTSETLLGLGGNALPGGYAWLVATGWFVISMAAVAWILRTPEVSTS